MWSKNNILAVLVGFAVFAVAVIVFRQAKDYWLHRVDVVFSEKDPVQSVNVIKGDEFDLTLVDGRVVRFHLHVRAIKNSQDRVIEFISNHKDGIIAIVDEKSVADWYGDLQVHVKTFVDPNGKDVNLSDWLTNNKLVYEK